MPIYHQYKGMLPKWAFHAHLRPIIKVDIDKESPISACGQLKWTCELLVRSIICFALLREILHTSVSTPPVGDRNPGQKSYDKILAKEYV